MSDEVAAASINSTTAGIATVAITPGSTANVAMAYTPAMSDAALVARYRPTLVQAARDLEALAVMRRMERHEPAVAAITETTAAELRELLSALGPEPAGHEQPRERGGYLLGRLAAGGLPPIPGRVDRGHPEPGDE